MRTSRNQTEFIKKRIWYKGRNGIRPPRHRHRLEASRAWGSYHHRNRRGFGSREACIRHLVDRSATV